MEDLLTLLKECCPDVDFENSGKLISDKVIDSVDLVSIISDIEDRFEIEIDMEQIEPENFDSVEAIWALIESLK